MYDELIKTTAQPAGRDDDNERWIACLVVSRSKRSLIAYYVRKPVWCRFRCHRVSFAPRSGWLLVVGKPCDSLAV